MRRLLLVACSCLAVLAAPVVRAAPAARASGSKRRAGLSAAQIAERNVKARGGLQAWRAVRTLKMSGQLDAGGKTDPKLPFALFLERPHKSRVEISFAGKNAVQVFNGAQGWKLRPFLNRDDVEPFKPDELREAASSAELDGPLVDYARKGTRIELAGTEKVEGRKTYKLELTLKSGERRFLWVDASTFLDAKISGDPRKLDGRPHQVAVYSRDYRTVGGLKIPFVQETVVEGVKQSHRMVIKSVTVNPPLQEALFAKPTAAMARVSAR